MKHVTANGVIALFKSRSNQYSGRKWDVGSYSGGYLLRSVDTSLTRITSQSIRHLLDPWAYTSPYLVTSELYSAIATPHKGEFASPTEPRHGSIPTHHLCRHGVLLSIIACLHHFSMQFTLCFFVPHAGSPRRAVPNEVSRSLMRLRSLDEGWATSLRSDCYSSKAAVNFSCTGTKEPKSMAP
jgi:hypothetical protein